MAFKCSGGIWHLFDYYHFLLSVILSAIVLYQRLKIRQLPAGSLLHGVCTCPVTSRPNQFMALSSLGLCQTKSAVVWKCQSCHLFWVLVWWLGHDSESCRGFWSDVQMFVEKLTLAPTLTVDLESYSWGKLTFGEEKIGCWFKANITIVVVVVVIVIVLCYYCRKYLHTTVTSHKWQNHGF